VDRNKHGDSANDAPSGKGVLLIRNSCGSGGLILLQCMSPLLAQSGHSPQALSRIFKIPLQMREGGFASARQTHFWATPPTEEGCPPNIPSAGTSPNGRNYPDAKWEPDMMRPYMVAVVVLAAFSSSISPARSDQYPVLNVAPLCHGLTDRSNLQLGLRDVSFDACMKAEQVDRESISKGVVHFFGRR